MAFLRMQRCVLTGTGISSPRRIMVARFFDFPVPTYLAFFNINFLLVTRIPTLNADTRAIYPRSEHSLLRFTQ